MRTIIAGIILFMLTTQTMAQHEYSKAWKKVDSLQNLGQPQSAREEVMKIYQLSKESGQDDQLIKSLLYKINIEENYLEESWQALVGNGGDLREVLPE